MSLAPTVVPVAMDRLRDLLTGSLRGSPLAFIRRINVEADRELQVQKLTASEGPDVDLCFIHTPRPGLETAVVARTLAWDSNFFGYTVARLDGVFPLHGQQASVDDHRSAVTALLDRARAAGVTYLFAIVDPRDTGLLQALGELGFPTIETRVYYHRELDDYEYRKRFAVRAATPSDVPLLSAAARDTVNPFDRFHADPFVTRAQADRMMATWVEASIVSGFADITLVPDVEEPRAFCTVKYHRDKWDRWGLAVAQPVFSAVAPEFKGWYPKLISEVSYHLRAQGARHAFMTTQSTNSAVISTWESLGYRYGRSEHILRKVLR